MLHMSNLTFYKFLFIIALLIAESMFLFRLKRKPHFPLRLAVSTIFMLLFVAGFPVLAYNAIYSSLMFTVFFRRHGIYHQTVLRHQLEKQPVLHHRRIQHPASGVRLLRPDLHAGGL